MKVLTIREPYVTPIADGRKHYETRSWYTSYRGEILIHTAKSKLAAPFESRFPLGHIVLKARLTDCIYMDYAFLAEVAKDQAEYETGFYGRGRYAWKLEDVEVIDPVPARGMLGLWDYSA